MLRLTAAVLLAAAALQAVPATPVLAISIDHAISRPGRNGRGIERPLFLLVYKWQTKEPEVKARSFSGKLKATCVRLRSSRDQWNAELQYEAQQENEPAFTGSVKLNLTIDDAIVRGSYEGSFHGTAFSGRAGAGLAFEHDFDSPDRGLLLWMAHPERKLRGIVMVGNGGALEERQGALVEETQALAAAHDLAIVATAGLRPFMEQGNGDLLLGGLRALAEKSAHPELEAVPIFFMGHSGGGFMAAAFNQWLPSRVGGYISSHGSCPTQVSKVALENPALCTAGENDPKVGALGIESGFVWLRLAGARASLVVEQGGQHEPGPGSTPLWLYTLEHMIAARLPAGAATLQPVDESQAWVADNATWKLGITKIMPAKEVGDALKTGLPAAGLRLEPVNGHVDFAAMPLGLRLSWLLDKDVAYVYRGAATYSNPLKLARADGHGPAYTSGETVKVECIDFGTDKWKSVAVYDGARQIGVVTQEKPQLTLPRQSPGAHAGVLVGELASGELRTSTPVLWSVWP